MAVGRTELGDAASKPPPGGAATRQGEDVLEHVVSNKLPMTCSKLLLRLFASIIAALHPPHELPGVQRAG